MKRLFHIICWSVIVGSIEVNGIVRGKLVTEEQRESQFSFAVSITKEGVVHCSGILLNAHWTLTTCSCLGLFVLGEEKTKNRQKFVFSPFNFQSVVLIGGSVGNKVTVENYDNIQLRIPIAAEPHPNCSNNSWSWTSDYGAYKTDPFDLTRALRPAQFVPEYLLKDMILLWVSVEALCSTIGWGRTKINFPEHYHSPSDKMRVAQVYLIDWDNCGYALCLPPLRVCDEKIYNLGKLCAGPFNGSDSCGNDEGGALLCGDSVIIGFMSRSICCGEYHKPTIYSSIINAYSFIEDILQSSSRKSFYHAVDSLIFSYTLLCLLPINQKIR